MLLNFEETKVVNNEDQEVPWRIVIIILAPLRQIQKDYVLIEI